MMLETVLLEGTWTGHLASASWIGDLASAHNVECLLWRSAP